MKRLMRQPALLVLVVAAALSINAKSADQPNRVAVGIGVTETSEKMAVDGLSDARTHMPHIALRLKPLNRFSFGFSAEPPHWLAERRERSAVVYRTSGGSRPARDPAAALFAPPDGTVVYFDRSESGKVRTQLLGSFYANVVNRQRGRWRIQLSAVVDGGALVATRTSSVQRVAHPLSEDYHSPVFVSLRTRHVASAVYGGRVSANYWWKHLGFSASGGYRHDAFRGGYPVAQLEAFFVF